MRNMDFPVINHAIKALRIQKKFQKEPVLERMLFHSKTEHEFAGVYLALWHFRRTQPVWEWGNVFQAKAVNLACEVRKAVLAGEGADISSIGIRKDILAICKIQQQVSTSAYSDGNGSNYSDYRPLSKAELSRREERAEKTGVYGVKARKKPLV